MVCSSRFRYFFSGKLQNHVFWVQNKRSEQRKWVYFRQICMKYRESSRRRTGRRNRESRDSRQGDRERPFNYRQPHLYLFILLPKANHWLQSHFTIIWSIDCFFSIGCLDYNTLYYSTAYVVWGTINGTRTACTRVCTCICITVTTYATIKILTASSRHT